MFVVRLVTAVLLLAVATTAWPLRTVIDPGAAPSGVCGIAQPMTPQCGLSAGQIENN
jgi:hypothetical protein